MDEPGELADVGGREVAGGDSVAQDVLEQQVEFAHVVCQFREGSGGEDGRHRRTRREVPAAEVFHLGAHVEGQTVHRVLQCG
ncbi:hypothetical protein AHiyo1_22770 [Arthrobacter sp. Hiyo1]|nr:hypothetical protein AHiyo1_22770 [Arthrobacter sp. Hiyo1]